MENIVHKQNNKLPLDYLWTIAKPAHLQHINLTRHYIIRWQFIGPKLSICICTQHISLESCNCCSGHCSQLWWVGFQITITVIWYVFASISFSIFVVFYCFYFDNFFSFFFVGKLMLTEDVATCMKSFTQFIIW